MVTFDFTLVDAFVFVTVRFFFFFGGWSQLSSCYPDVREWCPRIQVTQRQLIEKDCSEAVGDLPLVPVQSIEGELNRTGQPVSVRILSAVGEATCTEAAAQRVHLRAKQPSKSQIAC